MRANRWLRGLGVPLLAGSLLLAGAAPGLRASQGQPTGAQTKAADALFEEDLSDKAFQDAFQKAKTAKVPEQLLIEARLLRALRSNNTEAIADLAGDLEKLSGSVNIGLSKLFRTKEDAQALALGAKALDARRKGDAAGFEKGLKEAFWLSPGQADLYGSWAKEYQQEQRLANFRLPLDLSLQTADGGKTTLAEVLGKKKALLIDFWASWCGPCMALMDELKERQKKLAPQGVVVVGMNTENDTSKALGVKKQKAIAFPWLVEPENEPFSRPLGIDSIPRMILVSPEGKILYNGHPKDPKLNAALKSVGATL